MTEEHCQGDGGGWGTLVGVRLSVLLLADPDRAEAAKQVARALESRHHRVTFLAERRGALSSHLLAARAAQGVDPKIVHGVGGRGFGAASAPVARGIGARLIVSLGPEDLVLTKPKKLAKLANAADAVLLQEESLVEPLRSGGMKRDVYILPNPDGEEQDTPFMRALEIVYGRVLTGEVEPNEESGGAQLVQIGGLEK